MNILFHLGHPAHFHLFKNTIKLLQNDGNNVYILIKKKDILEELLIESQLPYYNILPEGRKDNKIGLAIGQFKQDLAVLKFAKSYKIDLMLGTSVSIAHVGKLLRIPSIIFNEDDSDVVPFFSYLSYPFADIILSPDGCRNNRWENKTIHYNSYHELAYLHPNNFVPNLGIVNKYLASSETYFILRFSGLNAHHDKGISGINTKLANELIAILKPHGKVVINSERILEKEFEEYRLSINPLDMHHLLAYAKIYIGDSQTMAAEAGVLGVPFLRFNDFVGKITYLDELENVYKLGYGFKTNEEELLKSKLSKIINKDNLEEEWRTKREDMLNDKVDFTEYTFSFISYIKKEMMTCNKLKFKNIKFSYNEINSQECTV
ncbi:MAG: DUF354 domain-containing protein [Romboutsia sp.]|nr:DUF354 domain-containing protein [Romboutsia sp.]MCB9211455.1 DUF354 domain-containing protein [Ignavibacteriales bacterium]